MWTWTHSVSYLQVGTLPQSRQRLSILTGGSNGQTDVLRLVPHRQLHFRPDILRRTGKHVGLHCAFGNKCGFLLLSPQPKSYVSFLVTFLTPERFLFLQETYGLFFFVNHLLPAPSGKDIKVDSHCCLLEGVLLV